MKSLYCTADVVGIQTGGGIVTHNEVASLKEISTDIDIFSRNELDPVKIGIYSNDPFVFDYIADAKFLFEPGKKYDLAHFYAGMFSKSVHRMKDRGTKVSYMADAHNIKISQEEFGRSGIPYNFPHITNPALWESYIEGYRCADLMICPSKHSADFMKSVGCKNVVIIPHGINFEIAKDCIPLKETDPFHAGYLGQVGPDKGIIYLIEAWKALALNDAYLKIAGHGTENLRPLIQARGGGFVDLLGFINGISSLYNKISVYIQPSVTEGFGLEVLEAMLFGRPVIVSEGAGASDLVTNGLDGFVVPIRSPEAIADKILYLYKNRNRLVEMGLAARKKAEKYSWSDIRPLYHAAWKSIL